VNFSVEQGEMLALLGPSGCGKTTILRMIAGLVTPTSGSIRVEGREIANLSVHQRNMGMVFQSYALLPHLTVEDNVGFGLDMRGVRKPERKARVDAALEMVKLGGLGGRRISQLSGGQQQRAALARSLVINPSLLLLDEPLSNLDARLRDELRGEIRDLQKRTGTTSIFVTHDQTEALAAADRVAVMSAGRIEQIGLPAEIYNQPATKFVANFIGEGTYLPGIANGKTVEISGIGPIRIARSANGPVQAMIRPHKIRLNDPSDERVNRVAGTVEAVSFTGEQIRYYIKAKGNSFIVTSFSDGLSFRVGEDVAMSWAPQDVVVIPE
jgi:putative spermidine/putrescine transport system ATP-binding protein